MQRTHSSTAPHSQALHREAETLFSPAKPSSQPQPTAEGPPTLPSQAPHCVSGLDQSIRSRVFAVIGPNRVGSVNTQHQRCLMREVVTWIPDFKEFAALCTESMHKAWQYDRDFKVRTAHTTRAQWLRLFRYFAQRHQIDADLRIQAVNKMGYYVCELTPRRKDNADWREFLRLGRQLGATLEELKRLKAQITARAVVTHPAMPLNSPAKGVLKKSRDETNVMCSTYFN